MRTSTILKQTVMILILNIVFSNPNLFSNNLTETSNLIIENDTSYDFGNYKLESAFDETPYENVHLSNYTLSVKLHEADAIVEGNLTVDYYNDDPVVFNQIPFHLYPSGMKGDQRPGNITVFEVKTLDGPHTPLNFNVLFSEQLMWINLTTPLNPSERISFYIHFNTTLPDGGIDRTNYHGTDEGLSKIFKYAVAYPMPAVYDEKDGWNVDPYLDVGDPFYSDMAWYDFFVEVPINSTKPDFVVAATGKLIETIKTSESITYHYDPQLPVRELTFSASRYFLHNSTMINDLNISTYYLPKSQTYWENFALDVAVQAVSLYNESFGPYPYPTFNVVEEYTQYGGMEHPLQVYVTDAIYLYLNPLYILELIIAHETCHQWFYHLVGNDEVDAGYLDEGLVVWSTDYYFDHYYPEWDIFQDYSLIYEVRNYKSTKGLPNKINQTIYEDEASGTDYWYIAYHKTPAVLQKLRMFLGDEIYLGGIQLFFNRFEFKIAWLDDLQDAFEDTYGKSLDWFFLPWFNNKYLPNYNFTSVILDINSSLLNITIEDLNENENEYQYSQRLLLEIYDKEVNVIYSKEIWINGTTSLSINLNKTPDKVRLIYTSSVLAQISNEKAYIEWTITEKNSDNGDNKIKISGMPYIPLFMSFSVGIIISLKSLRNKKKTK
ncbi:MAG: M1 family metallopeptidase [Promethearchaeota archaeon]